MLATFTVTNLDDAGAGSLRQAVIDANSTGGSDDIVFQSGLNGTIALTSGEMSITESVTITGNGAANTVIDAQQASRIFNVSTGTIDVTLTDITLTNGEITSGSPASGGAVFFLSSGTLAVNQSVLTNNFATVEGGAIFSPLGSVVVSGSTLTSNSSNAEGGAIYAQAGPLTVADSTLSGNSSVFGGAIEADNLTISRSELAHNNASTGGAISAISVDMEESTLSLNVASMDGGAMYVSGAATITQSTFVTNTAETGGAIYAMNGPVTVLQSTLDRNLAIDSGSDMSGNAIYSQSAPLTIRNSIVASQNNVGRSVVQPSPGDAFVVEFSLIGTNIGTSLTATGATTPDANGNLIGDSLGIAPGTGVLADNGGPTMTVELLPGSPALNRGSNALASGLASDQRRAPFARVFGGTVDMGAYESQDLSLVVDTNQDEDDGDYSAGDLSLREAIRLTNGNPGPDTITFAAATNGTDFDLTLGVMTITDSLTITGNGADNTVIDAQNMAEIFEVAPPGGANPDLTVQDLALVNGMATANRHSAIASLSSGTLTLSDIVASGNTGGAVSHQGTLNVTRSTFAGNSGAYATGNNTGAAIFANGAISVTESTLSANTDGSFGGAISGNDEITVTQSTLTGNSGWQGGAIYGTGGTITVIQSTLTENTASGGLGVFPAEGGGIYSNSAPLTIRNSIVAANTDGGTAPDIRPSLGAVVSNLNNQRDDSWTIGQNSFDLTDSPVANSFTTGSGAGWNLGSVILNLGRFEGAPGVAGGEIDLYLAADSGGVPGVSLTPFPSVSPTNPQEIFTLIPQVPTMLTPNTSYWVVASANVDDGYHWNFTGDVSQTGLSGWTMGDTARGGFPAGSWTPLVLPPGASPGAAMFQVNAADLADMFVVESSLIGTNTGTGLTATGSTTPDAKGNLIGDANGIDPLLAPLADNGGPTETRALLTGSPAINRGSNAIATPFMFDQRGAPFDRVLAGTVDMGAFESPAIYTTEVSINASGDLLIEDINGADSNDLLTLSYDPGAMEVVIVDPNNDLGGSVGMQVSNHEVRVPLTSIPGDGIIVLTYDGTDSLTVDPSMLDSGLAITYTAGNPTTLPGDSLTMDLTGVPAPVVIDPVGGTVIAGGRTFVEFSEVETLDLTDGERSVEEDELYVRTTGNRERIVVSPWNDGGVKLRISDLTTGTSTTFTSHFGLNESGNQALAKLTLFAGAGDDLVSLSSSVVDSNGDPIPAEFHGEEGNDYLTGANADDILVGGPGDDRVSGGEGNNQLFGDGNQFDSSGALIESLTDGDDNLAGRNGNDQLWGGGGRDRLRGSDGDDVLNGGSGDDTLDGGQGVDILRGEDGDDVLNGSYGDDILLGGAGEDRLYGRQGNDILIGGTGADELDGSDDKDLLVAGTTDQDSDNDAALLMLLSAWSGGANNLTGITGDGDADSLQGGSGVDEFWAEILPEPALDDVRDADTGESVNNEA